MTYRDGMSFAWENGRILKSISTGDNTVTMKYDSNGMRTQKDDKEYTTSYYYDSNNNLIGIKVHGTVLYFYYDSEGNATSFSHNGTKYYYVKNLQGDVVKIIDRLGNVVVSYTYDAWGKILNQTDSTVYNLANINPFRYRGYVYDNETGLYYLQSRYYDPITGRFLNADVYCDTQTGSPLSTNMFAYCENNAIRNIDANGYMTTSFAALNFASSYGLSLGGAALIAKLSAFLVSIAPYLLIGIAVVVVAYTAYVITKNVSIRNIMKKIPNKLKTKDKTKVDLDKFNKKLPNGGGWQGPGGWKIVKDFAKHSGSVWKLLNKSGKRIATLWADGRVRGK